MNGFAPPAAPDDSGSPCILLVDDEVDILPEYQELLEMEGFAALTESNPRAAIQIVLDHPSIALVITDLKMAEMDGALLIERLRAAVPPGRPMSYVVMTGDASSNQTMQLPGVPILLKPIDLAAFVTTIKTQLALLAP